MRAQAEKLAIQRRWAAAEALAANVATTTGVADPGKAGSAGVSGIPGSEPHERWAVV